MDQPLLNADERRKRRRIWISGTIALLVLAAACVAWVVRHIPGDIAARTTAALQTAGLDPRAAVSVKGRTVTLSGEVPDAYTRARMRAIAGSVRGVRAVRDHLAVAPLQAEPLRPAERTPHPAPPEKPSANDRSLTPATAGLPPPQGRPEATAISSPDPPPAAAAAPSVSARPAPADIAPAVPARPPAEQPSSPPEPAPPGAGSTVAGTGPASATDRPPLPLLHFEFGSARLTPDSRPRLQEIAEVLRKQPALRVELAGHSDAVGPRAYNQRLSLRRAQAVADWLVSAGIDPARLHARGYRESRPLKGNHSREGRAMNRRVELVLIP